MFTKIFTKSYFNNAKWSIYHLMNSKMFECDQVEMDIYNEEEYHIIAEHEEWCFVRNKDYEFHIAMTLFGKIVKLYVVGDSWVRE